MIVYDACGQTPSFMLLTKMRPSEPFTVFACRAVHDELALLFTVLFGPELETMRPVPPGLDIWRDVRFERSDDVPAGTIVFASRAAFTYETRHEWRDNAWLVEIVNVGVLAPPSARPEQQAQLDRIANVGFGFTPTVTHGLPPPLNAVGTHRTNGHPVGCRCGECDAR